MMVEDTLVEQPQKEAELETEKSMEPPLKKLKTETDEVIPDSNAPVDNTSPKPIDPLGYTKTEEFTSEIYKVFIGNIHKFFSPSDMKKFLKKKLLHPAVKVKRPMKKNYAYVTFRNEEHRQSAIEILNKTELKGVLLTARKAEAKQNPFAMNQARGEHKKVDCLSVREKVAPLYKMEYAEQLELKLKNIQSIFDGYKTGVEKVWPTNFNEEAYDFKISEVKQSPKIIGYRNKCDFSIGESEDTKEPYTVGFVKGRFGDGNISIEDPKDCIETCPPIILKEVENYHEFIKNSGLPPYNPEDNSGVWKGLQVRVNRENHVMLTAIVDTRGLSDVAIQEVLMKLVEKYKKNDNFSVFMKEPNKNAKVTNIVGAGIMEESLCGFKFQITENSFFQVNTEGAEILYHTIKDFANLDEQTILLDVCCGTGTIGIILAKHVKHVHGFEIVEAAVVDAKINAQKNNVNNVTYYPGNAKFMVPKALKYIPKSSDHRIVAIVDPPRSGLHADVISCLRNNEMITELIYVSCEINFIKDNIVNLCRPSSRKYDGLPFRFVDAVSVDMFPHTKKFEVILRFRRDRENVIPVAVSSKDTQQSINTETVKN